MDIAISGNKVKKGFGNIDAIKGIDFEINKGEIFGFIGPDGGGKTTLFRIITTLLLPDSGKVSINGLDIINDYKSIRKIMGYMPQRFSLYNDLTVYENLNFFASVYGTSIEENYNLIRDIYSQLEPFKNRRAGKLSGGMKQKLALSCALIHKPEILILDEPTTGVDAISRIEFWEILHKLAEQNITIVVATPYMDEASRCNRVALIQDGYILTINTPTKIIENFTEKIYQINSTNTYELLNVLKKCKFISSAFAYGSAVHATIDKDKKENDLFIFLNNNFNSAFTLNQINPTIEDCFMNLINSNN
jgi:ABC-type multidrug transport system ATPase subunit